MLVDAHVNVEAMKEMIELTMRTLKGKNYSLHEHSENEETVLLTDRTFR